MNVRTWKLAVAALALLPLMAGAAEVESQGMSLQARTALVDAAPQGTPFQSSGQTYRMVGGLRATPRAQGASVDQGLAAARSAPADLVEQKGPYLIFRESGAKAPPLVPAAAMIDQARSFPVVVNTRTGRLGVAANVLVVKLADVGTAQALAAANGLELDFVADRIGYAFFRVPDGRDLLGAVAAMSRDGRVTSAEIEVREHFATAR